MAPGKPAVDFNNIINAGKINPKYRLSSSILFADLYQTANVAGTRHLRKKSSAKVVDRVPLGLVSSIVSLAQVHHLPAESALQRYGRILLLRVLHNLMLSSEMFRPQPSPYRSWLDQQAHQEQATLMLNGPMIFIP